MIQEFVFGGTTVIYDTESIPLEYISLCGVKIIRPDLSYESRLKVYEEIRETASVLLAQNKNEIV